MAQQLKRWESPRRKGRNHKGRGGSAKQRQYKKRQKRLMKRLQQGINNPPSDETPKERDRDRIKNRKTKYSGEFLPETPKERSNDLSFFVRNQRYPDEGSHPLFKG